MKKQKDDNVIAQGAVVYEEEGVITFESETPSTIVHEEHHPIEFPSGVWNTGQVQEYDHAAEEARVVRD